MVVPGGIKSEFAQKLPVGVENADVKVADQHQDAGAGMAAAQADVVQAAVVPQGDHAGVVDAVVADAVVPGVDRGSGVHGLGAAGVCLLGRASTEGAVRPDGVVVVAELVEQGL